MKQVINTDAAPAALGTYSQAVKVGDTVYLSGQIPLDPKTMEIVDGDVKAHVRQIFDNLRAVAIEAGGDLADIVKMNVFLTDMALFPDVNEVMAEYIEQPYPARACVAVAGLPKGVQVEIEAIMHVAE